MTDRKKRKHKEQRARQKAAHAAKVAHADQVRAPIPAGPNAVLESDREKNPEYANKVARTVDPKEKNDRRMVFITAVYTVATIVSVYISVRALDAGTETTNVISAHGWESADFWGIPSYPMARL